MPTITDITDPSSPQPVPLYNRYDSGARAGNASEAHRACDVGPNDVVSLLRHSGASAEAERKICDLAGVLLFGKFFEQLGRDTDPATDPFTRLMRKPIDWSAVQSHIGNIVGDEQAESITPGLKMLVDEATPSSWQAFAIDKDLSHIRMGQPETWSPRVLDQLLHSRNLVGADLRGAPLRHVDLSHLNFAAADLSNADLVHARLNNTNFSGAKLDGVNCAGPLMNQYAVLHKTSDVLMSLLHPLVEAFVSCKALRTSTMARKVFQSGPLQEYSNSCKWNLLPPMRPATANFLAENLLHCSNRGNWLLDHQDLVYQLIHGADGFGLDDSLRDSLKERIHADPKVQPFLADFRKKADWQNHFIGLDPISGKPHSVPAAEYRNTHARLQRTPSFNSELLRAAISSSVWSNTYAIGYAGMFAGLMTVFTQL